MSQKHWLTYGVYSLVNNHDVVNNNGVLDQGIIDTALLVDVQQRINQTGEIEKGEPEEGEEGLLYDETGIDILKRILVNYRWAMPYHKRHKELLLPLATSLDEPEDFAALFNEFKKSELKTLLIEVELVNKPVDFFFKLATYLDSHLENTEHLWRSGAILHFYGSKETRALIEMPDNVLSLKVSGKDKESFQQLLVINIKETLKSYDNISAHSSERIWLEDDTSEMLSSDVIASLTSGDDKVQRIKDQLMEKARNMTTININGNVAGNVGGEVNHQGDNNQTININEHGQNLIDELQKVSKADSEPEENEKIDEVITALEKAISETDGVKKKGLFKKVVELANGAAAFEKVSNIIAKYLPAISAAIGGS